MSEDGSGHVRCELYFRSPTANHLPFDGTYPWPFLGRFPFNDPGHTLKRGTSQLKICPCHERLPVDREQSRDNGRHKGNGDTGTSTWDRGTQGRVPSRLPVGVSVVRGSPSWEEGLPGLRGRQSRTTNRVFYSCRSLGTGTGVRQERRNPRLSVRNRPLVPRLVGLVQVRGPSTGTGGSTPCRDLLVSLERSVPTKVWREGPTRRPVGRLVDDYRWGLEF